MRRELCQAGLHGATDATHTEGDQFARFGQLAFLLGALAGLAAVAAAGHPRIARALAMPGTVLAAGAVGCATAFVVLEPYYLRADVPWHTGTAWWIFTAGAALVASGAQIGSTDAPRAWLAGLALAAAALALALTAHGTPWWRGSNDDATTSASPATVELCDDDGCTELRLIDLPSTFLQAYGAPQARLMGTITDSVVPEHGLRRPMIVSGILIEVAAAVAALLAAALAGATLARRRARSLAWITMSAIAALGVAIAVFESYGPGAAIERYEHVDRSYGLPLAAAGAILAVVAAVRLARDRASVSAVAAPPELVAHAEIPACAACRVPMLWVGKRKLWLCTRCKARGSVTP